MRGSLDGGITFEGGGVSDVLTKTSGNYTSVVNQSDNKAYIDLSGYVKPSDLSNYVTNDGLTLILSNYVTSTSLSTVLSDYVTDSELSTALSDYVTDSELSTELTSYQPLLTAGDNITIENNVISASGGGGGASWDIPTDGTPVSIGTFGSMTLYAQSVSVNANSYSLCRFWTGQHGDIVLSANAIAIANASNNVKMVVPSSITNIVSFSWYTDDYEALPHLSIYSTLDSNLWSRGAVIKGLVIFAR